MGKQRMLCAGVITPRGGWMREERNGQVLYRRISPRRGMLERAITAFKWVVLVGFFLSLCAQLGHML